MKQFIDRDGSQDVFRLERDEDGLWLGSSWAYPTDKWNLDSELMFRSSKVSQEA